MNAPVSIIARYMTPRTTNVSATPTDVGDAKRFISMADSGAAMMAPPPKPITAMPVAMPRRSGNHRMSVAIGVVKPRPSPHPPITP